MPDADSPPSEPSALEPLTPDQRQLYLELLQHCESLFESPELRGGTPSPATSPDSTCSDISRPDTPSRVNPRSIAPRPATPEQPLADKFPHIPGLPKLPTPMPVKAESGASSERDSFYPKEEDQKLQYAWIMHVTGIVGLETHEYRSKWICRCPDHQYDRRYNVFPRTGPIAIPRCALLCPLCEYRPKIDPGANSEQVGMGVRIRSHIKLYHCGREPFWGLYVVPGTKTHAWFAHQGDVDSKSDVAE